VRYLLVGILSLVVFAPFSLTQTVNLKSIKRIYVDKMANELDYCIRAEITKKFKGRVLAVLEPEAADAVMVPIGAHDSGTAAVTGNRLGRHSGSVSLLDKTGSVLLWSSEAGDESLWSGAMKRGGPRKVADRLVSNLKDAFESNQVVHQHVVAKAAGTPVPTAANPPQPRAVPSCGFVDPALAQDAPTPSSAATPTLASEVLKVATLVVTSEVPSAEINMDRAFVGKTPTSLSVSPGLHRFEIKQGSQAWEREVQVNADSTVSIHADFGAPVSASQPPPAARIQGFRIICPGKTSAVPFSSSRPDRRHLACDQPITIVSVRQNWIRVKTTDGVEGNVAARFVGK